MEAVVIVGIGCLFSSYNTMYCWWLEDDSIPVECVDYQNVLYVLLLITRGYFCVQDLRRKWKTDCVIFNFERLTYKEHKCLIYSNDNKIAI